MTALIWMLVAQAQVVDTVGGTSSNNTGNLDYKLNTYDVSSAVRLQLVEMYLEEQWFGSADVTWVVYQLNAAGSAWDLVWQANDTVGGLGWHASPALNVPLAPGESYAIGVYFGFENVSYYWDNTPVTVSFGTQTGGLYAGNGNVWAGLPDPLNDSVSTIAYRQRLTTQAAQDSDGDGSPDALDCAPNDASIHPGAAEICADNVDQDCSGVADDNLTYADWWPDTDGDGFGDDSAAAVSTCDGPPADHVANQRDCDDSSAAVAPGLAEVCDGLDQNCANGADEGLPFEAYWPDADGDGYGDEGGGATTTCDGPPAGHVADATDCDDADELVYPGAPERCDGLDDDCDGVADNDVVYTDWWPDADGDGYGDADAPPTSDCAPPDGRVDDATDCDDALAEVNPGAAEVCDLLDNDCDGALLPDELDTDGDGALDCVDCDPVDAETWPGAEELCVGVDNDCDGEVSVEGDCDAPGTDEGLSIGSACGCATGGGSGSWAALGWLALFAVRRRGHGHSPGRAGSGQISA